MNDLDLAIKIALEMGASQTELNKLKILLTELSKMTPDPKVRAQIDAVLQGIKLLDGAIEKVTDDAQKAGKGMDDVANRARVENIKEVAGSISTLSNALLSVGKEIIQTTADFEMLEARMLTAAKGNEKLRDELMAFAKEAASSTPYSVQQVTDSIIKLEAYGFKAKEVFSKVGDMAAAYGKDLSQAVEAVADAQTGELERLKEFTITKQQLIDKAREMFGKEIVNAKGQITDLKAMNEALFTIMEERSSGAMGRMMDTYTGAMSNFKDAVEQMQQSIGKEFLPRLTEFVKWAGSVVDAFNSLDQGTKSVLSNLGLFTIAIVGVGGKLVSTGLQIQAFTASLQASQIAMLSFAGAAAGIGIVIGVVANSYIDAWRKMEEQKSEKIEEETKKIAEGFKNVKEAIELVNKTPVEISLDPKIEEKIASLEERIKAIREAAAGNLDAEGKTFSFELASNPLDRNNDMINSYQMDYSKAMDFLLQKQEELNKKLSETGLPADVVQKYKAQLAEVNLEVKRLYETLEKENPEMYKRQIDILEGSLAKAEEGKNYAEDSKKAWSGLFDAVEKGFGSVKEAAEELPKLPSVTDSVLNKQINTVKNLYNAHKLSATQIIKEIDNVKKSYDLTTEQTAKLDAWRSQLEGKIEQHNKKIQQSYKENWTTFLSELKVALSAGEISQKEYNQNISTYIHEHATELQNNANLKTKIEKEYYAGVNKLQKEQAKEAKEAEKERVESIKEATKESQKSIKEAWSTFIDEQTVKLNEGAINQKEYMNSIKKYQQDNMREIQKVSGLSLDIEKKYSQEVKKLRQEEAAEAKKVAEARLAAEEEIALEIEALDNDVTGSQLKNIQKKIDKFKDAGVEQVKLEEYTQKAIQDLQQTTQEKFDQQIQNSKDKIEDLAEKIRQIDVKLKENKEKQDKLTSLSSSSGSDKSSPIKSIEEAFSTGLGEFNKKMEELKKLEEESKKLQAEKAQAEREQKQAQEKLVKAQDDSKKATEELTAALKENTAALRKSGSKDEDSEEPKPEEPKSEEPKSPDTPTNPTSTQGQGGNLPGNNNTSSTAPSGTTIGSDGRSFAPGTSRSDQGWIRKPEGTVTLSDGRSAAPSTAITVMPDLRATSSQKTNLASTSGNQYGNYTGPTNITNITNISLNSQKFSASADIASSASQLLARTARYGTY
ncbi:MAG: phage tail tape measure protein [Candidatus Eremiobacterota bacterium]